MGVTVLEKEFAQKVIPTWITIYSSAMWGKNFEKNLNLKDCNL